jgi:hypothetical protein
MGITVERREIKSECNAILKKFDKDDNELSKYNWLIEWIDK